MESSEERAWGKTTILNDIGFTYQALGYSVLLITQYPNSNEHFATLLFDHIFTRGRLIGDYSETIGIVDEYDSRNQNFRDITDYLDERQIPYVGFVNFKK